MKNNIDTIALKRKLSKYFHKTYVNENGSINYEKLKETVKKLMNNLYFMIFQLMEMYLMQNYVKLIGKNKGSN